VCYSVLQRDAVCCSVYIYQAASVTQTLNTQQTGDYDLPTKAPRRDESVMVLHPKSCYVFGGTASTQQTGDCDFFLIYLEWGLQEGGVWCSVSHCNTLHNIAPRCNTLGTSKDRAPPYTLSLSLPPSPPKNSPTTIYTTFYTTLLTR